MTRGRVWLCLVVTFSILLVVAPITPQVKATASAEYMNDSGYFDSSMNTYYVLGEVQNTGNVNLEFVEVKATFYDWMNTVVGTEFTYTEIDIVLPGRKAPFWVPFEDPQAAKVHHYSLTLDFRETDKNPPLNLEILSPSSHEYSYGDGTYQLHIEGEIKNNGPAKTTSVNIYATCYGPNGRVVAIDETTTEDLDPAQKGDFEIQVQHPRVPGAVVNSCELSAESDDYTIIAATQVTAPTTPTATATTSTILGTSTTSAGTKTTPATPTTTTLDAGNLVLGLAILVPVAVIILVVIYVRARRRRIAAPQPHAEMMPPAPPVAPSVRYCLQCGEQIPLDVNFCNHCGASQQPPAAIMPPAPPVPPSARSAPPVAPAEVMPPAPPVAPSARYCLKCGEEIRSDADFCKHCGAKQP